MGATSVSRPSAMFSLLSYIFSPSSLMLLPTLALFPYYRTSSWFQLLPWVLLLLNHRSFPLFWHLRLLWSVIFSRARTIPSIHPLLFWTRSKRHQLTRPGVEPQIRVDSLPIGKDVFEDRLTRTFFAGPEDCDYNLHLSNSSYAKNVDYMRMEFLCSRYPRIFADGAFSALGGASYTFHKEIPGMSNYVIEICVDSWESKWLNVVARFKTPAHYSKQVVYCTAVSRYVTKSGRKTIPPWFVFATSGYGVEEETRKNWEKAEELRAEVLTKGKQAHELKYKGKRPLKRDSWLIGGGFKKFGLLAAFDPSRPEKFEGEEEAESEAEEVGLGKWQDRKNWSLSEFEPRRKANLLALSQLAVYPNPEA